MHHFDAFLLVIGARSCYISSKGACVAKKLHVEITPANWHRMKDYLEEYNADLRRVTPRYKPADVINLALNRYLKAKKA
jgi:hypothetical protein